MSTAFVPFAALAASQPQSASSASSASSQFIPLPVAPPARAQAAEPPPIQHQPIVRLHREGDAVRHIQIQCSCGQVIDLDCVY